MKVVVYHEGSIDWEGVRIRRRIAIGARKVVDVIFDMKVR